MALKLWNINAFLDHEFHRPPRLVDPIIPNTGDVLLHAKRGAGKTLVAWDLAIGVATGGLFLGQFQCRQGKVAYVETDMPDEQFHERTRPSAASVRDTDIITITTDGAPTSLMLNEDGNFRKRPDKALLDLAKLQPDLVIFDTLRKMHTLKENESDSPRYVYGAAAKLFPRACRVWCHHDGKTYKISTGWGTEASRDPEENFRGSSAWLDDASIGITIQRKGKGSDWKGLVGWTKLRSKWPEAVMMKLNLETMLIQPAEISPKVKAQRFRDMNVDAGKAEIAAFLQGSLDSEGNQLVKRTRAFEIAGEVLDEQPE